MAAAAYVVYTIWDIGRWQKCAKYVSCTKRISYSPEERLGIDANGKNRK